MKKGSQLLQSRAVIKNVEEIIQVPIAAAMQKEMLIKTKVRALSTNWQLHERMRYLRAVHERQQGYLVDKQMQYEELDGKHQYDLALREIHLNKLTSTKEMFKILSVNLKNTASAQKQELFKGKTEIEKSSKIKQDILKVDNSTDQFIEYRKKFFQDYETEEREQQRANDEWEGRINEDRKSTSSNLDFLKNYANNNNKLEGEQKQRGQYLLQTKEEFDSQHEQNSRVLSELEEQLMKEQIKSTISEMETVSIKYKNMINEKKLEKESQTTALVNQENFTEIVSKKTQDKLEELTKTENEASERKEKINKGKAQLQIEWEELEFKIGKDILQIEEREKTKHHFNIAIKLIQDQKDTLNDSLKTFDSEKKRKHDIWAREKSDVTSAFEEIKSRNNEIHLTLKEIEEDCDIQQNKLSKLEELKKENTKIYAEQTSEVTGSTDILIKRLAAINETAKQDESELNKFTENMTILKEANETHLQNFEMNRNKLLIAQKTQDRVDQEHVKAKQDLEILVKEIIQTNEKIRELRTQTITKNSYCGDQLEAWDQESAILSSERETLNNEIMKNNKQIQEEEGLAQETHSALEDKLKKHREKAEHDFAEKKSRQADLQTQTTAKVYHKSDVRLQFNQVREAQAKSELTRDNVIRDIATSKIELQAIKHNIIRIKEEKLAHNQAVNEEIKKCVEGTEEIFKDNMELKNGMKSIGKKSKSNNSRRKEAMLLPAEGRQSPVLGSNPGSQIRSPRLLIQKDRKQVKFASPEIAPSPTLRREPPPPPPPDRTCWDYYSDNSDGGAHTPQPRAFVVPPAPPRYSAGEPPRATTSSLQPRNDAAAPLRPMHPPSSRNAYEAIDEETPTKDSQSSQLAPPPSTPRQNKFFSSRRLNRQHKRIKISDD